MYSTMSSWHGNPESTPFYNNSLATLKEVNFNHANIGNTQMSGGTDCAMCTPLKEPIIGSPSSPTPSGLSTLWPLHKLDRTSQPCPEQSFPRYPLTSAVVRITLSASARAGSM